MSNKWIRGLMIAGILVAVSTLMNQCTRGYPQQRQETRTTAPDIREHDYVGTVYRVVVNNCTGKSFSMFFQRPITDRLRVMGVAKDMDPLMKRLAMTGYSEVELIDQKEVIAKFPAPEYAGPAAAEIIKILQEMSAKQTSFIMQTEKFEQAKFVCNSVEQTRFWVIN